MRRVLWAVLLSAVAIAEAPTSPSEEKDVLAAMDADSAGAIMNALPANAAARISRAVAQVPLTAGR